MNPQGYYYMWNNPLLAATLKIMSWILRGLIAVGVLLTAFLIILLWLTRGQEGDMWLTGVVVVLITASFWWTDAYLIRSKALPNADGASKEAQARTVYDSFHKYRGRTK